MGADIGDAIRALHESRGVVFHLQRGVERISADSVQLDDGQQLPCDLVVVGIGVKPRLELARGAGLEVDDGVRVNQLLQAGPSHVYAAGDIANWPDAASGMTRRISSGQGTTEASSDTCTARPVSMRRRPSTPRMA